MHHHRSISTVAQIPPFPGWQQEGVSENTNKDNSGEHATQACTPTHFEQTCFAHAIISTLTPQKTTFLSRRGKRSWQTRARACVCVRQREIERELRRHQKCESGEGEAHTEKLLISRVTVMLPLNERNINTFSSFQGGFSALKTHPAQQRQTS